MEEVSEGEEDEEGEEDVPAAGGAELSGDGGGEACHGCLLTGNVVVIW